jgi:serine/threonine protein kinase
MKTDAALRQRKSKHSQAKRAIARPTLKVAAAVDEGAAPALNARQRRDLARAKLRRQYARAAHGGDGGSETESDGGEEDDDDDGEEEAVVAAAAALAAGSRGGGGLAALPKLLLQVLSLLLLLALLVLVGLADRYNSRRQLASEQVALPQLLTAAGIARVAQGTPLARLLAPPQLAGVLPLLLALLALLLPLLAAAMAIGSPLGLGGAAATIPAATTTAMAAARKLEKERAARKKLKKKRERAKKKDAAAAAAAAASAAAAAAALVAAAAGERERTERRRQLRAEASKERKKEASKASAAAKGGGGVLHRANKLSDSISTRDVQRFYALFYTRVPMPPPRLAAAEAAAAEGGEEGEQGGGVWPGALVPERRIERVQVLGRGAFGAVHLARLRGHHPHPPSDDDDGDDVGGGSGGDGNGGVAGLFAVKVTAMRHTERSAELHALRMLRARPHPSLLCCVAAYRARLGEGGGEGEGSGGSGGSSARVVELLVLPYCAGGDLYSALQGRRGEGATLATLGLGEARALAYAAQVACGLQHCHDVLRIAHCDVKPENVVLSADGSRALLTDFGLAVALDENGAEERATVAAAAAAVAAPGGGGGGGGAVQGDDHGPAPAAKERELRCGTLYFAPPELLDAVVRPAGGGGAAGAAGARERLRRADFWALGCVLFEMLSGFGPWDALPSLVGTPRRANKRGSQPADVAEAAEAAARARAAERAKLRKRIVAGQWELQPSVSGAARAAVAALLAADEAERVCSVEGLATTELFGAVDWQQTASVYWQQY